MSAIDDLFNNNLQDTNDADVVDASQEVGYCFNTSQYDYCFLLAISTYCEIPYLEDRINRLFSWYTDSCSKVIVSGYEFPENLGYITKKNLPSDDPLVRLSYPKAKRDPNDPFAQLAAQLNIKPEEDYVISYIHFHIQFNMSADISRFIELLGSLVSLKVGISSPSEKALYDSTTNCIAFFKAKPDYDISADGQFHMCKCGCLFKNHLSAFNTLRDGKNPIDFNRAAQITAAVYESIFEVPRNDYEKFVTGPWGLRKVNRNNNWK